MNNPAISVLRVKDRPSHTQLSPLYFVHTQTHNVDITMPPISNFWLNAINSAHRDKF